MTTLKTVAMSAIVLLATAGSGPQAPASPAPTNASIASNSPSPTGKQSSVASHGPEVDISASCISGGPTVSADAILWTACETYTGDERRFAQILEHDTRTGITRVLHRSAQAQSGISQVKVSSGWILWAEYTDLQKASDTRIYAKRRSGGDAILLEEAQRYGPLANLMETALDGADAYWSVPVIENGEWHGRLMHRTLPDGASEVTFNAPKGSIITWPSVRDGAIAYERDQQWDVPQSRVLLRLRDGTEREIGDAPNSEPSLGDGFVAFKQSERYAQGDLRAQVSSNGRVLTLGPGEAPKAFGGLVTWQSSTPTDPGLRLATPVTGCTYRLDDLEFPQGFPHVGQTMLAWTHADPARPGPAGIQIRYAELHISADTPCRN